MGHFTRLPPRLGVVYGMLYLASAAFAGPIAEKAGESEKLLAAGKPVEAWRAMENASAALWDKLPLRIAKAVFVVGKPQGYGIYNPRTSNVFKPGEPLVVYAEPIGFGHAYENGVYTIALKTDIEFKDRSGKVLVKRKNFGDFQLASRHPNREFFLRFEISLSGAPEGDYILTVPIHDEVRNQNTEFSLPFSIRK